ncbi:hypothetical protein NE237_028727 [Protea cynaroides]|uniref:Phytocyanin domain-containing protein n=1 Tax=Protea cynaroides TaxID=273540 RepID=A0A9Q0GSZ0_9MAGN|nr:hypothetical protein NE237_028727 [Protea cynaroides]
MERSRVAAGFLLMILALCCVVPISATDYTVGDSTGWTTNSDYSTWTRGKTFAVGDNLVFNYGGGHTVDEVTSSDYNSCTVGNSLSTDSSGATKITLKTPGSHYFICGAVGHCSNGMKLAVNVAGKASQSPSPSPSPSPSTPTTPSISTSPIPSISPSTSPTTPSTSTSPIPSISPSTSPSSSISPSTTTTTTSPSSSISPSTTNPTTISPSTTTRSTSSSTNSSPPTLSSPIAILFTCVAVLKLLLFLN